MRLDDLPAGGNSAAMQSLDGSRRATRAGASAPAGGAEDLEAVAPARRSGFSVDPADGRVLPVGAREGAEPPLPAGRNVELPATADPGGDEGTIRAMARATLGWMHERLPWSGGKDAGQALPTTPVPLNPLALPVETAGAASHVFTPHVARAAATAGAQSVDSGNLTIAMAAESAPGGHRILGAGPEDAFGRFLRFAHELLAHPLTWLAIALVAALQILVSRNGRRRH